MARYEHSNQPDFEEAEGMDRRQVQNLLRKAFLDGSVKLAQLDAGQRQRLPIAGWGWVRLTTPRKIGMPALRKQWGIEAIKGLVRKLQHQAEMDRAAGRDEKARVLDRLANRLKRGN